MKKILFHFGQLSGWIVVKPAPTLRRIAKEKFPLFSLILIFLFSLVDFIPHRRFYQFLPHSFMISSSNYFLNLAWYYLYWLILSLIIFLFGRIYKGKGNFFSILDCIAFGLIPLNIGKAVYLLTQIEWLRWLFLIWGFGVLLIAIKESQDFSYLRAVIVLVIIGCLLSLIHLLLFPFKRTYKSMIMGIFDVLPLALTALFLSMVLLLRSKIFKVACTTISTILVGFVVFFSFIPQVYLKASLHNLNLTDQIVIDGQGCLFSIDFIGSNFLKIDQDSNILARFGGEVLGGVSEQNILALDEHDNFYVLTKEGISIYDNQGQIQKTLNLDLNMTDKTFFGPVLDKLAVDKNGYVLFSSFDKNSFQMFNPQGELMLEIEPKKERGLSSVNFDREGNLIIVWGISEGPLSIFIYSRDGNLIEERNITENLPLEYLYVKVTPDGYLYLGSYKQEPFIYRYDINGKFILSVEKKGSGREQIRRLYGFSIDRKGNIYALDRENFRIQKYNSAGNYIKSIPYRPTWLTQAIKFYQNTVNTAMGMNLSE